MATATEVFFRCVCGAGLAAPEDALGKPGACPSCGRVLSVPAAAVVAGDLPAVLAPAPEPEPEPVVEPVVDVAAEEVVEAETESALGAAPLADALAEELALTDAEEIESPAEPELPVTEVAEVDFEPVSEPEIPIAPEPDTMPVRGEEVQAIETAEHELAAEVETVEPVEEEVAEPVLAASGEGLPTGEELTTDYIEPEPDTEVAEIPPADEVPAIEPEAAFDEPLPVVEEIPGPEPVPVAQDGAGALTEQPQFSPLPADDGDDLVAAAEVAAEEPADEASAAEEQGRKRKSKRKVIVRRRLKMSDAAAMLADPVTAMQALESGVEGLGEADPAGGLEEVSSSGEAAAPGTDVENVEGEELTGIADEALKAAEHRAAAAAAEKEEAAQVDAELSVEPAPADGDFADLAAAAGGMGAVAVQEPSAVSTVDETELLEEGGDVEPVGADVEEETSAEPKYEPRSRRGRGRDRKAGKERKKKEKGKKPAVLEAVPCPAKKCDAEIPEGEEVCPECGAARARKKSRLLRAVVYLFGLLIVFAVAASAVAIWTPHLDPAMTAIEKSQPKVTLFKWREVARNFVAAKGWLAEDLIPGGNAGDTGDTGESTPPVKQPAGDTPPAVEPEKKAPENTVPPAGEPKKTEPEEGPVG